MFCVSLFLQTTNKQMQNTYYKAKSKPIKTIDNLMDNLLAAAQQLKQIQKEREQWNKIFNKNKINERTNF
jgi:Asp/Glu/hydantoin racemase|tara:strand:+ start:176 stop:385 length:210 start_codon:yes stop_codon:yes gene_type:complete